MTKLELLRELLQLWSTVNINSTNYSPAISDALQSLITSLIRSLEKEVEQ